LAVRNELETLMAAAVMVAGTSAVTAQSMPTYTQSVWQLVTERAGALGGLLHHDGGARLLDDCWNN
jgi:hypothetical protein